MVAEGMIWATFSRPYFCVIIDDLSRRFHEEVKSILGSERVQVQKRSKQQSCERIDVGDSHGVSDGGRQRRSAARAYGESSLSGSS